MIFCRAMLLLCALAIASRLVCGQGIVLPDEAVAKQALTEVTAKSHECAETLYHREEAVEECCTVMAEYFGPNSTRPSRNGYCVEAFWTKLQTLSEKNYIDWSGYLDRCTELGYEVYYFQDGEGPCAPPAPAPAPVAEAAPADIIDAAAPGPALEAAVDAAVAEAVEEPALPNPMRSFGGWLRGLDEDGWGLASFIIAIISVFGTSAMAFTFIYDATIDLRACFKRKTA